MTEKCNVGSYFEDICNKQRTEGCMGTVPEGFDGELPFCALADNDAHINFAPIASLLKPLGVLTPQELLELLNGSRANFQS